MSWQLLFLPHAAAGFAQVVSRHLPQSVLPSVGEGGGATLAEDAAGAALDVSLDADDESAAAGMSALEDAAAEELPESSPDELSSAGVSGGLPPPQASHTNGPTARARIDREEIPR
jgi:hypothetical protein